MLIPGEVLWVPRLPYRLPGTAWRNPAHDTAYIMMRVALLFVIAWLIWQWVTEPIVDHPCSQEPQTCVTTT